MPVPEINYDSFQKRKEDFLMPCYRALCKLPTVKGFCSDLNCVSLLCDCILLPTKISHATLAELLQGMHKIFEDVVVVDCRYSFEYDGGHIGCAMNIPVDADTTKQLVHLYNKFISRCGKVSKTGFKDCAYFFAKVAFIFHCEFSQQRGPQTLRLFRALDRNANLENYPNLSYFDVYLLEGGYHDFFPLHQVNSFNRL